MYQAIAWPYLMYRLIDGLVNGIIDWWRCTKPLPDLTWCTDWLMAWLMESLTGGDVPSHCRTLLDVQIDWQIDLMESVIGGDVPSHCLTLLDVQIDWQIDLMESVIGGLFDRHEGGLESRSVAHNRHHRCQPFHQGPASGAWHSVLPWLHRRSGPATVWGEWPVGKVFCCCCCFCWCCCWHCWMTVQGEWLEGWAFWCCYCCCWWWFVVVVGFVLLLVDSMGWVRREAFFRCWCCCHVYFWHAWRMWIYVKPRNSIFMLQFSGTLYYSDCGNVVTVVFLSLWN